MPKPMLAQLVLLELAAAAVLGAVKLGGDSSAWRTAGVAVAAVLLLVAFVPLQRRWMYQLLTAWVSMLRRRRTARGQAGLAGLVGNWSVESVPASVAAGGRSFGAVRSGTTWCLPLVLGLDGVFNDDGPVPVDLLERLLQVEDVPLSSVRLFTLTTPAQAPPNVPSGPTAPLCPLAARYCLLTLDTRRAAAAISARGGSRAAVEQILRRCAVHTEQTLSTADVPVGRLGAASVESLFATWLGPAAPQAGRRADRGVETWRDVRVAGTRSTLFAITGRGPDVVDRVSRLAAAAPTPVVATSLVLQPARRGGVQATMLLRLSTPDADDRADLGKPLALLAQAFDLVMQRLGGEQGRLLGLTTPVGVGDPT